MNVVKVNGKFNAANEKKNVVISNHPRTPRPKSHGSYRNAYERKFWIAYASWHQFICNLLYGLHVGGSIFIWCFKRKISIEMKHLTTFTYFEC